MSSSLRRRLLELGGTDHVELVPNTVDDAYWTLPEVARVRHPFIFYGASPRSPHKGFDVLISVFASRFMKRAGVQLVIGGDGAIRRGLEALAQRLGVSNQVRFLGAPPRDGVRQAMWESDCFILPSNAENFGVVLIEALATGLPVISTRCGGPEDIIAPDVGLPLEPGDEAALGDSLVALVHGSGYDATAVTAHASNWYNYSVIGTRLLDIHRRALGST